MQEYVEIEFRSGRISYYLNTKELDLIPENWAIIEVDRGKDIAKVLSSSYFTEKEKNQKHTEKKYKVIRSANKKDLEKFEELKNKEKSASDKFKEIIIKYPFEMKLIDTVYQFDMKKLTFFFTADGRVDFREFVRELASIFRTRIELHQISGRDVARRLGGIGLCGKKYCCTTFLRRFNQITIKMVKDQNLSGNLSKISGPCGRLLCCLNYEQDFYKETSKEFPDIGEIIKYLGKKMTVSKNDYYNRKISLVDDDDNIEIISIDDYKLLTRKSKKRKNR